VALEVAVKDDAYATGWPMSGVMPGRAAIRQMAVVVPTRRGAPGVVAMRPMLGPTMAMPVSLRPIRHAVLGVTAGSRVTAVTPDPVAIDVTLLASFGMRSVVSLTPSWSGQGGGTTGRQGDTQDQHKQSGFHGISPFTKMTRIVLVGCRLRVPR